MFNDTELFEDEGERFEEFEREVFDRQMEIRDAFVQFLSVLLCDDAEKVIDNIEEVETDVLDFLQEQHDIITYRPSLRVDEETGCSVYTKTAFDY